MPALSDMLLRKRQKDSRDALESCLKDLAQRIASARKDLAEGGRLDQALLSSSWLLTAKIAEHNLLFDVVPLLDGEGDGG